MNWKKIAKLGSNFRKNCHEAVLEKIVKAVLHKIFIFTNQPRSPKNYSPDIETEQCITSENLDAFAKKQFNIFHSLPKGLLINRVTGSFTLLETGKL